MALKLFTESDVITKDHVGILIYGYPGLGKTSLAQTAEKTLLLDFDNGVERAVNRQDVVKIDSWDDIKELVSQGIIKKNGYQTVIIDTAGTCLDDYLASHVIKKDPKNEKKGGGLALSGYGAIKDEFKLFYDYLRGLGVDLIFIAHLTERMEGDEAQLRPKITGGSYDMIVSKCDEIGYMHVHNNKRILSFTPEDNAVGKDAGELGNVAIPEYVKTDEYDGFMDREIVQKLKKRMDDRNAKAVELSKYVKGEKEAISKIEDVDGINTKLVEVLAEEGYPAGVIIQVKYALNSKAKELGLKYDEKKSMYVKKEKESDEDDKNKSKSTK